MTTTEKFLYHKPCKECGSRDNLGVYENHTYCFGCHDYQKTTGVLPEQIQTKIDIDIVKKGFLDYFCFIFYFIYWFIIYVYFLNIIYVHIHFYFYSIASRTPPGHPSLVAWSLIASDLSC